MSPDVALTLVAVMALVAVFLAVAIVLARDRRHRRDRLSAADADGAPQRRRERREAPIDTLRLIDAAGVGLLRVDGGGTIVVANETVHRLLGRTPGSLPGLTVIGAFLDHRVDELLDDADARGAAEMDLLIAGEPPRTLLVHAERARGGDGDGRWLIVHDVSELRRLQRIRTEFIDNLSHELRTPLTTIRVLSEVLSTEAERQHLPPRVRDTIAKIDVESQHLAQMVGELLDLARIEQGGGGPLRREPLDLGRVLDSALDRLRAHAERQGVRLVRGEAPAAPEERTIGGDAERLEQLLLNLVHNAVKFSPDGGEVVVYLRHVEGELVLEVADQGVGIPPAELERIFERFYKVDRARTREGAGTGLGLAIARHVAEGHGGRIWAESEEGRGSRFFVALPRAQG